MSTQTSLDTVDTSLDFDESVSVARAFLIAASIGTGVWGTLAALTVWAVTR